MTAISIIVAAHNAAPYLQRFIPSIQGQTFKDFEVLCIDDASTDETGAVLEGCAAQDARFKLLRRLENHGAGAARNWGIREAKGETLCFADPDDLLPEKSLEVRYAAFTKYNAVVRACHDEVSAGGRLLRHETRPAPLPDLCKPGEAAARVGVNPFLCAHWTWLFPTKMLQKQGIFNEENTRTAEDIIFLVRLFFKTAKLVWLPDVVYHWIKRPNSLSTIGYTPEHYADYLRCVDLFYAEAKVHGQIRLADSFCNEYLSGYLPHLLWQAGAGKSSEGDVQKVIRQAADLCNRQGVFSRHCSGELPGKKDQSARYPGLSLLWQTLNNQDSSMIKRLARAFHP